MQAAHRNLGLAALLAFAIWLVYAPVLAHEFVAFDDDIYITEEPDLALGLSVDGIRWALTSAEGANWFPLTRLSWLVDQEIHGLSAGGVHATNLVLHTLGVLLLFFALLRMTGRPAESFLVAGLFALHPLNVESVAWASERKGLLAGVCFAAALLVAGRPGPTPGLGRSLGVAVALIAGLLAKPVVVTLPFVLLLLDHWPLGRTRDANGRPAVGPIAGCLLEKLPLLGLVAASAWITVRAQSGGGATVALEQLPLGWRLENAAVAYRRYAELFVWPRGLAVYYPHPGGSLATGQVLGALAILGVATAAALACLRRVPAVTVGWLWFVGMLVPTIGVVQVGSQAMADRYAYLPTIGLAIAAVFGLAECLPARAAVRRVALVGAIATLLTAGVASRVQLGHWHDTVALLSRAVAVTERNHVAHAHLARAHRDRGDRDAAIRHYDAAVRIRPGYLEAANNLAWLLATHPVDERRDGRRATELALRVVAATGRSPSALDTLAAAQAAQGRFDRAIRLVLEAVPKALGAGDEAIVEELEARLRRYRDQQPWIETDSTVRGAEQRPGRR